MIRVWIKTPSGHEMEISDCEMRALLSEDWMETDSIGYIADTVASRLGLPVKVQEVSTYYIGYTE